MTDKPTGPTRKRKIGTWLIRAVYIVIMMAMVDSWSACYSRYPIFSVTVFKMSDGGTTRSVGLGYCLTYWRQMGGEANGPEVWFWLLPFTIDSAHGGVQLRWVWSER